MLFCLFLILYCYCFPLFVYSVFLFVVVVSVGVCVCVCVCVFVCVCVVACMSRSLCICRNRDLHFVSVSNWLVEQTTNCIHFANDELALVIRFNLSSYDSNFSSTSSKSMCRSASSLDNVPSPDFWQAFCRRYQRCQFEVVCRTSFQTACEFENHMSNSTE